MTTEEIERFLEKAKQDERLSRALAGQIPGGIYSGDLFDRLLGTTVIVGRQRMRVDSIRCVAEDGEVWNPVNMITYAKTKEEQMTCKSVLDNIPVNDNAFPLSAKACAEAPDGGKLSIVGACPQCGSPVYGRKYVGENDLPTVKRTCQCELRPGAFAMQTK